MIPSARATPAVAGTKRAHSPVELLPSKKMAIKPEPAEYPCNLRHDTLHQFDSRDYDGISALQDIRPKGGLERSIVFKQPANWRSQARDNSMTYRTAYPAHQDRQSRVDYWRGHARNGRAPPPNTYHRSGDRERQNNDLYKPCGRDEVPSPYGNGAELRCSSVNIQEYDNRQGRIHPRVRLPGRPYERVQGKYR